MDADDKNLQSLFSSEQQFIIPVFQRKYSWTKDEWEALWEDIQILISDDANTAEHFIGAFVTMSADSMPGDLPRFSVIDGQQRLITFSLILCAIRDRAKVEDDEEVQLLADEINDNYLIHKYKTGLEQYRIISRAEDRDALFELLAWETLGDEEEDTRIADAYNYFTNRVDKLVTTEGIGSLRHLKQAIMQQMPLAMITVSEDENPYAIFETLNERGLRLEESDLIRNYVFMQLNIEDQEEFNERHWQPFENKFSESSNYEKFDLTAFYRTYLMREGEYVRKNGVYDAFRHRITMSPDELVDELDYYSDLYLWIERPTEAPEPWMVRALERLDYLDIGTASPLVLNLLSRWKSDVLPAEELNTIFEGLESFAVRRSVCGESTRGYYRLFPGAINHIENGSVADSLFSFLSSKGWPDDEEFRSALVTFDLYSREVKKCRLILETLQQEYGHKEPVELNTLTIEHVMPQEIDDDDRGRKWKAMLGDNWERVHDDWLHTLGNLTLTGYNSELSNCGFKRKKNLFMDSKIDLNNHFTVVEQWTETEIHDRGEELAQRVAGLWEVPSVDTISTEEDDSFGITLIRDDSPVESFENTRQSQIMVDTIEYVIQYQNLLNEISIPYVPGTGDGYRALINEQPMHTDGSEMESYREIGDEHYVLTKLAAKDKRRYLRELARKCGLVCRFDGGW